MKHLEKVAPVAGAVTAVSTLLCCLPLGFVGAAALGSLGAVVAPFQSWLLGGSVVLLLAGAFQIARPQRACRTRTTASFVILALCAGVVLTVVLFPQVIAGIAADWLP
jgi:hypothetical protein